MCLSTSPGCALFLIVRFYENGILCCSSYLTFIPSMTILIAETCRPIRFFSALRHKTTVPQLFEGGMCPELHY
jgi:hypothetical protein